MTLAARLALIFLIVLHTAVLLAGFVAPYDYAEQHRDFSYAPPAPIHFVDSAGNFPPTGTCPCTIQRAQANKADSPPLSQIPLPPLFSQQLQEVVNSGVPAGGSLYGGGLPIAGNVLFGSGSMTNTAYYAAVTTFKDFPVFSAYDQSGNIVDLPRVITTVADQPVLSCNSPTAPCIKSVRLTINLLGNGASGYDPKTGVRPVVTLVGNGRIDN